MIPEALLLGAATAIAAAPLAPPGPAEIGLLWSDGTPGTLGDLRGRYVWVYMGFVNCPDICPRTLESLAAAYAALSADQRARVVPVFVSVDPMRDTPARLQAYAGFYHPDLRAASGGRAALDALAASLNTRYAVPANATPTGTYSVSHPNEVFVLDPQGRFVGRVDASRDDLDQRLPADLAARLAAPPTAAAPVPPPSTAAAWCGTAPGDADDPDPNKHPLMHRAATMGSGTSVLPGATPMRMWAFKAADWLLMAHLQATPGYVASTGLRGDLAFTAENWQMLQASRYWGPGIVDLRAMTSLEPWTLGGRGTPQLFQLGETYQGLPLIDAQHPHDLLMELAGRYTWTPDPRVSLFGYGGVVGEPAFGPPAYMHRPSAADDHWAPLAHHLQDASHITHGVLTAGGRLGDLQLEGSVFNGRDPDEDRVGIAFNPLSSWSGRLSWFPGRNVVAQLSHGYWVAPHDPALHPGDEQRTSASFTGVVPTALGRWSTSLIWGNAVELVPGLPAFPTQSYGLESQLDWAARNHLYGRFELLDRPGVPPYPYGSHAQNRINALTLGFARDLGDVDKVAIALGGDLTAYSQEAFTQVAYGPNPITARVYLRLRPPTTTHPEDRNPAADDPG